jgi:hypothetical protein
VAPYRSYTQAPRIALYSVAIEGDPSATLQNPGVAMGVPREMLLLTVFSLAQSVY